MSKMFRQCGGTGTGAQTARRLGQLSRHRAESRSAAYICLQLSSRAATPPSCSAIYKIAVSSLPALCSLRAPCPSPCDRCLLFPRCPASPLLPAAVPLSLPDLAVLHEVDYRDVDGRACAAELSDSLPVAQTVDGPDAVPAEEAPHAADPQRAEKKAAVSEHSEKAGGDEAEQEVAPQQVALLEAND